MRKIAICVALLAITTSVANAKDDFDALLGELTFGGSTNKGQTLTLQDIAAENLAPAPAAPADAPIVDPPAAPAPTPEPMTMPEPVVDQPTADQPYVAQECSGPGCDNGCSSCQNSCQHACQGSCHGHGQQCGNHHGHFNCVPHTPPNLPNSSLYQYFKSDACNCRVWDGWQRCCHGSSKHSRGECDCFDPRKKKSCLGGFGCFGRGVHPVSCRGGSCSGGSCSGTTACEAGCHQLPAAWQGGCDCAGEATCAAAPDCGCDG